MNPRVSPLPGPNRRTVTRSSPPPWSIVETGSAGDQELTPAASKIEERRCNELSLD